MSEEKVEKKIDKIFDNKFGERNFDGSCMSFKVDASYVTADDMEKQMHHKMLFDAVHSLVMQSEFKKLNELDEDGNYVKLNKVQINKVYGYVVGHLCVSYRKMEIWSVLSEYFDIYPAKFYSSLSNVYKHELMTELDSSLHILDKKNIKKLF